MSGRPAAKRAGFYVAERLSAEDGRRTRHVGGLKSPPKYGHHGRYSYRNDDEKEYRVV
jgi:hypothetical protein